VALAIMKRRRRRRRRRRSRIFVTPLKPRAVFYDH
jgi:hypothetical protein